MTRLAVLAAAIAAVLGASAAHAQTDKRDESGQAFARIAEVLRHPRCLNCHPMGDFPRQADDRHRHRMQVMRGPVDRGNPALPCTTCHQRVNTADGRVPGAPNWHLAPRSMGWEGLGDGDLCRTLKDGRKNGGKTVPALVRHMTEDPLVQWAWNPGPRQPPPLPQHDFHDAVRRWADGGAGCPP